MFEVNDFAREVFCLFNENIFMPSLKSSESIPVIFAKFFKNTT